MVTTACQSASPEPLAPPSLAPFDPSPSALDTSQFADDLELLNDFIGESTERLSEIERLLLAMERHPRDPESIHGLFRCFHTIKGLAGFLGLQPVQEVAHETETLLDAARNGTLALTPDLADVVLRTADYLHQVFSTLRAWSRKRGALLLPPHAALVRQVAEAARGEAAGALVSPLSETTPADTPIPETAILETTVRVDARKLEVFSRQVAELMIAHSRVRDHPTLALPGNASLAHHLARLARATEAVRKSALSMRMIPAGQLFQKMTRLVHHLARKSGKSIRIEVSGEIVELDRAIVQEVTDPVIHMIRNSVDHGFESADERRAAGKNEVCTLRLEVRQEPGLFVITVADDGRGLDQEKILRKAWEQGAVPCDVTPRAAEIHRLIFAPGFSTAERVTDISGRGVGMDVVRQHVARLRGAIEIHTVPGQGTAFTLRLPLPSAAPIGA